MGAGSERVSRNGSVKRFRDRIRYKESEEKYIKKIGVNRGSSFSYNSG